MSTPFWVDELAWFSDEKSFVYHYQRQGGGGISEIGIVKLTPAPDRAGESNQEKYETLNGYRVSVRWLEHTSAHDPDVCPDGKTISVTKSSKDGGDFYGLVLIDQNGKDTKSLIPEARQAVWRPIAKSK